MDSSPGRPLFLHPRAHLRDLAKQLRPRLRGQRLPENALTELMRVLKLGDSFAQSVLDEPLREDIAMKIRNRDLSMRVAKDFSNAVHKHLKDLLGRGALTEPMKSATFMIFLFGMSSRAYTRDPGNTNTPTTFLTVRALMQAALTRTFLALPEDQARDLHSALLRLTLSVEDWARSSAGAIAVTRLAHAFLLAGALVYQPIPYYDVFHAGDLLVEYFGQWFYIQVKADSSSEDTKLLIPNQGVKNSDHAKLLAGSRQFAVDTGLPIEPMFAEIGFKSNQSWRAISATTEETVRVFLNGRLQKSTA